MQMQLKLLEANRPGKVAKEKKGEVEEVGAPTSTADMAKGEYFKQLSGKIIEIENKLSIATKREADSVRARGETETRNTTLKVDLDKYQRSSAENASQLASLQSLYDMQARTVQGLESDQEVYAAKFEVQELKLREMEVLRATLERKEKQLGEVQGALSAANSDILNFQNLVEFKSKQVEDLQQQLQAQEQKHLSTVGNLEQELAATLISSKRFERELEEERVKTAQMERIQKELAEALGEIDKLNGQINHMQRKSESQTKDLQKVMKESASTLAEFEKALIRKSEECNELYLKLSILQEQVEDERKSTMRYKLMQAGRTNTSQIATSFISRLKRSSVAEIADKDRDSTGK
ncbi:hypothetical protein B484DRAFT_292353 [Ochromonadaceae sp. CCMP2298]|nr:hypothetical protein B484DRAFT_292353 [Ochromonadaceae sp. CCMP2298]